MKLLILTQKVDKNDPILGFFHRWIIEFSQHVELLTVICLEEGAHDLPDNVRVYSLGKEDGKSRLKYIWRFYSYIFTFRKDYDSVFVHMNQIYIVLGGVFWRFMNKQSGLWYAHGSVSLSLRISKLLVDNVFTSTESGFRIKSSKKKVVGQGIDTNKFTRGSGRGCGVFKMVSVGRISPVKDYETILNSCELLSKRGVEFVLDIIGGPGTHEQERYLNYLESITKDKGLSGRVNFLGSLTNDQIVRNLQNAHLYLNASYTGSLDKAILEAMSTETPILSCNEALLEILNEYKKTLMFEKGDFNMLSDRIEYIINLDQIARNKIGKDLRKVVVKDHSISDLIRRIKQFYE